MSAEQNKSMIYRWVEAAWNHGDFSQAVQIYPPTYLLHDTSSPVPFQGPAGLQAFISAFRSAMPDLHMTVVQVVAEDENAAWRFRAQGTQTGGLMGIPPTGRAVDISGEVFSRFSNGQWVEDYSNADQLTMLRQMGIIPQPDSVG